MHSSENTSQQIQEWLAETFPLAQERNVGPHDSLLDSGIIDSLGTLEVVAFLETEFGVQVTDEEMVADHFESIHALTRYVEAKRSSARVVVGTA